MGSKAPTQSPPDDDSSPPPPKQSSPPPSPPRSPPPTPPPTPKQSPPPAKNSSPPPSSPPPSSPPPSPKQSPPPAQSSPPPSSPPPSNPSPPPAPATTTPSPPPQQNPVPTTPETKSPAPPFDNGNTPSPPATTGGVVNSPPEGGFVSPPPAVPSGQTTVDGSSDASQSSGGSSSSNVAAIAGGVIGGVVFIVIVVCIFLFCRRKKKQQKNYNQIWNSPSPDKKQHAINIPPRGMMGMPSPPPGYLPPRPPPGSEGTYSPYSYPASRGPGGGSTIPPFSPEMMNQNHLAYEDLVAATDGFSSANVLGQGGFGFVHKGVLPGGKEVAVKCLKSGSGQGEREFQAEVDIISRVHHRYLVSLVGYCIANEKRLLVYEYVCNNTLEYHLHKSNGPPLDFSTRVRIALGSAKGLAYLHEDCHPRIIHRDIKAANILLDYNFEAQVADFGLARLYNDTNTHVSTRVMGTFGYLAPEYASSGKLTDKSDVFSFGVVLLELITGRRAVDLDDLSMEDASLVDWARPLLSKALIDGNYDELVDPRLERNYNTQEMANMVACAAASIRHSAKRRPRMSQVVRTLEGDMSGLDGTRTGLNTPGVAEYDTAAYNVDLKKFRQMAFGTETTGIGSTNTTSEYGLDPSSSTSATSSSTGNSPRDSTNYSNL